MPVAPLATVVRDRGRTLGGIRPPRQIPDTIQGSSSPPPPPPRMIPGSVPNVPAGFGARSRSPGRDQDHDGERGSRSSYRPGPWFLQPPVEKSFGGWGPVIDLSPLNEFIRQTPFRMETPNSVLLAVRKDGFLASIDLKDAYFQIPVYPSSRKLLFHFKRYGLPVQSPVFRVIDRPTSVHKSFRGGLVLGSLPRSLPAMIPGRLADPVLLGGQDKATRESAPCTLPLPRHSHKRGEVPPQELCLYSDAPRSGWGAHLLDQSALGLWSNQETSLHINILEMKALFLALQPFRETITDQRVTAMCDNSMVVAYVSKQGGTVSDSLCELTEQLLRWTEAHNVLLEARYLLGQSNVLADLLSRRNKVLGVEWSLLPQVAKKIIRTWGSPTIDLFATHLNAKLPLYCSLIPDPQAVFEDAHRHPWNHRQRDPKSLHDADRPPLAGEVVVCRPPPPTDPTSSGAASVGPPPTPTPLPSVPRRRPHPEPSLVEIVKRLLRKSGLRDELRASCPDVSESPLHACTSRNGSLSVVGVMEGALLRSTPLYP